MPKDFEAFGERAAIRFMRGDRAKRDAWRRRLPHKWESDGHFIRCAVIYYLRYLDFEHGTNNHKVNKRVVTVKTHR